MFAPATFSAANCIGVRLSDENASYRDAFLQRLTSLPALLCKFSIFPGSISGSVLVRDTLSFWTLAADLAAPNNFSRPKHFPADHIKGILRDRSI